MPEAEAARAEVINLVNNFFYEKLVALPAIEEYMEEVKMEATSGPATGDQ
jgi:hypothetical protein